jgi:predicted nucleic acid-binding protein
VALNQAVVSDSTTLISLLNIDRFELLFKFSKTIIISQAVYAEVSFQNHAKQVLDEFIENKQVVVKSIKGKKLAQLLISLDLGESESILLAKKENLPLIIDEKKGRSVATEFGLKAIGLIGILLIFKKAGELSNDEITDIVNDLRKVDFWVSDSLLGFLLSN